MLRLSIEVSSEELRSLASCVGIQFVGYSPYRGRKAGVFASKGSRGHRAHPDLVCAGPLHTENPEHCWPHVQPGSPPLGWLASARVGSHHTLDKFLLTEVAMYPDHVDTVLLRAETIEKVLRLSASSVTFRLPFDTQAVQGDIDISFCMPGHKECRHCLCSEHRLFANCSYCLGNYFNIAVFHLEGNSRPS